MQELNKENMTEKATPEEIEAFLLGNDPEKYIVALEYGWRSSKIYKIKEDPKKGKIIFFHAKIPHKAKTSFKYKRGLVGAIETKKRYYAYKK